MAIKIVGVLLGVAILLYAAYRLFFNPMREVELRTGFGPIVDSPDPITTSSGGFTYSSDPTPLIYWDDLDDPPPNVRVLERNKVNTYERLRARIEHHRALFDEPWYEDLSQIGPKRASNIEDWYDERKNELNEGAAA